MATHGPLWVHAAKIRRFAAPRKGCPGCCVPLFASYQRATLPMTPRLMEAVATLGAQNMRLMEEMVMLRSFSGFENTAAFRSEIKSGNMPSPLTFSGNTYFLSHTNVVHEVASHKMFRSFSECRQASLGRRRECLYSCIRSLPQPRGNPLHTQTV